MLILHIIKNNYINCHDKIKFYEVSEGPVIEFYKKK